MYEKGGSPQGKWPRSVQALGRPEPLIAAMTAADATHPVD